MNFNKTFSMFDLLYGSKSVSNVQFGKATYHSKKNLTNYEKQDFIKTMILRKQFIQNQCSKQNLLEVFIDEYDKHEVYIPYENVMFCPIYKASSTTWYQNFMILWVRKNVHSNY